MKKIGKDKWRHFYAGIFMGWVLQLMALHFLPLSWGWSTLIVFVLVACISYGFEVLSLILKKGVYEVADAVATVIGGVLGMVMAFATMHLVL